MVALEKTIVVNNLEELAVAAQELVNFIESETVILLNGSMGAGKTTFVKEMGRVLNIEDNVTSPTFSIVNEYRATTGQTIYHFDFYRIKNQSEAYDMGFEDYLYSGNYCFIEWPEKVSGLLPENCITVEITEGPEGKRVFTFQK
jgi:tRNA threonylcarbamoyladenosine biosynthesis protein TsaE